MSSEKIPPYDKAIFSCTACGKSNVFDYTQIEPLISGQMCNCQHCGISTRLAEEDRRKLDAQLDKSARFARMLIIWALPFFLIGLVLVFVAGGRIAAFWTGGGLLLFLLIRMISSSEPLQLKLLAVPEETEA